MASWFVVDCYGSGLVAGFCFGRDLCFYGLYLCLLFCFGLWGGVVWLLKLVLGVVMIIIVLLWLGDFVSVCGCCCLGVVGWRIGFGCYSVIFRWMACGLVLWSCLSFVEFVVLWVFLVIDFVVLLLMVWDWDFRVCYVVLRTLCIFGWGGLRL